MVLGLRDSDRVGKLFEGRDTEPSLHGTSRSVRRLPSDTAQESGQESRCFSEQESVLFGRSVLLSPHRLLHCAGGDSSPALHISLYPAGPSSHARHTSGGFTLPDHTLLPSLCCPGRGRGDLVPGGAEIPASG